MRALLRCLLVLALAATGLPSLAQEAAAEASKPTPQATEPETLERPLSDRIGQEALAFAESASNQSLGSRTFRILRPPVVPRLRPGTVSLEASHLSKPDATGPFFVVVRLLVDGKPAGSARVDLEGRWKGTILKAKEALPRQCVPNADQLEELDFEGAPPAGALNRFPEGFRLRLPVAAGHILTRADLQAIPVLNAGETVRLDLVCGGLIISTDAIARTPAAMGEKVRLEVGPTKRNLQAIATGRGTARVEWAQP